MNTINFKSLHERALSLAKQYKTIQTGLLDVLQEIDASKAFRHLGFGSLWDYCRLGLQLSESDSSALIRVARKSIEVPQLKKAVQEGTINLSAAKRIASVVTPQNQDHWLKKAAELPQRELERAIVQENPKALVRDSVKPLRENKLELRCSISLEAEKLVRRVQDLESQKRKVNIDLEQTLIAMAEAYLRKNDPVERAKRQERKLQNLSSQRTKSQDRVGSNKHAIRSNRTPIPRAIAHAVYQRDKGQCVWMDPNGNRCNSRRFVELHHIQPLCHEGKHEVRNIASLCSGHHKALHEGVRRFRLAV